MKFTFCYALLFISTLLFQLPAQEAKIPDCMLSYRFGPEQYVVVVEKSSQNLLVYSNYKDEPVDRFKVTSGKKNGRKLEEGDLRTPEGIYFFKRILTGDELPKYDDYGEKAFTLNYPNPIDVKENRNGSGIWLHGAFAEDKTDSPNNSRGCVVMKNRDLVNVSKYIFLDKTPICIYETIRYDTVANIVARRNRMIERLRQWKSNWEDKNIDGYINFYHSDFSYNNMSLADFKDFKNTLNQRYKFIHVALSDINIYGFNTYHVVTFNQLYISDANHFYARKVQYWSGNDDNALILDEDSQALPQPQKFELSKGNFVTIDHFRRSQLEQIKNSSYQFTPHSVYLANVSIIADKVKLFVGNRDNSRGLKVIPVLRFENESDSGTEYRSLSGITLQNGMPQDNSKGVPLKSGETILQLEKEPGQKLKSLTLFMIGNDNRFEQIITYFVNKTG